MEEALEKKFADIRLVLSDVDGVHTDDTVVIGVLGPDITRTENGKTLRLIPGDADGAPESIEYFAPDAAGTFMEGYRFFSGDGVAVKECIRNGIPFIMLSGRNSPAAKKRADDLGARYLPGVSDKLETAARLAEEASIPFENILFIGNDIQDLSLIRAVGLSAAPADAVPEVKSEAAYVASRKGGSGVVREILERMLSAKGLWDAIVFRKRTLDET